MAKIKIIETDSKPKCPYCKKELDAIEKKTKGWLTTMTIYMCPHCKAVLSISDTSNV
jgi:glutaredoxin